MWTARRLAISAFLIGHMGAVSIWVLSPCPIQRRFAGTLAYYILPLGLWQYWGMFAPDPVRDTVTLEAEVIDVRGIRYIFAFPKLADYSRLEGVLRFRHSKYAANMAGDESGAQREFAVRHAIRQLGLTADAFPVDVHLRYQVRVTPPPGEPPADPMLPTQPLHLASYHFPNLQEVGP
jgi:hypothetical protein